MGDLKEMLSKALSSLKYEEQARKRRHLFGKASRNRCVVFRRKEALWVGVASSWHCEVKSPHLARAGQT